MTTCFRAGRKVLPGCSLANKTTSALSIFLLGMGGAAYSGQQVSDCPQPEPTQITLLHSGEPQPWTLPWRVGMTVPDFNVDGGLQAINLSVTGNCAAPAGSIVLLQIAIDENGTVTPDQILNDTSGFGPDVMEAAKSWKFKPPTAKGHPVRTAISVRVQFPGTETPAPAAQGKKISSITPQVTLLPGGEPQPWSRPWRKGLLVPDYNVDGGLQAINLIMPPIPNAPAGGLVLMKVTVDEDGNVAPSFIPRDTSGFSDKVMEAARAWKFKPPKANGNPVGTAILIKVTFPAPIPAATGLNP